MSVKIVHSWDVRLPPRDVFWAKSRLLAGFSAKKLANFFVIARRIKIAKKEVVSFQSGTFFWFCFFYFDNPLCICENIWGRRNLSPACDLKLHKQLLPDSFRIMQRWFFLAQDLVKTAGSTQAINFTALFFSVSGHWARFLSTGDECVHTGC